MRGGGAPGPVAREEAHGYVILLVDIMWLVGNMLLVGIMLLAGTKLPAPRKGIRPWTS